MITAIMVNEDHISSHFTKADSLLLIDEQGQVIERLINPAINAGCKGKQSLVKLINQHAQRVVVRNIGEKILEKLLAHNIAVFKANSSRLSMEELVNPDSDAITALTEPSQGRPSIHHQEKKQDACCSHKHSEQGQGKGHARGHGCDHPEGKNHGLGKGKGRCCQS